jgi:hypothetical protein
VLRLIGRSLEVSLDILADPSVSLLESGNAQDFSEDLNQMYKLAGVLALATLSSMGAFADPIQGTFILSSSATLSVGSGLNSVPVTANPALPLVLLLPDGDFTGMTGSGSGGVVNTAALSNFSVSVSGGTFIASSGSIDTQNANFLSILYKGIFVPGGLLSSFAPSNAEASVTMTRVGTSSITWGASVAADGSPIPEPSTYALIGGSLAGLALLRRRAAR